MNVPQHVAIILDGNGRWAKAKGMPQKLWACAGQQECGARSVRKHGRMGDQVSDGVCVFHRELESAGE